MEQKITDIGQRMASRGARRFRILSIVAAYLTFLSVFAYLASRIVQFPGERSVSTWIQRWDPTWLDLVMNAVSAPGFRMAAVPLVVLTLVLLYLWGMRKESVLILASALVGSGVAYGIKAVVARPRPPADLVQTYHDFGGYSFPSSHVIFYVVILGTLAVFSTYNMRPCVTRRLIHGSLAFALIAIGISRIYLGAHWPVDVVGAYAYGLAVVAVVVGVWRLWIAKTDADVSTTGLTGTNGLQMKTTRH